MFPGLTNWRAAGYTQLHLESSNQLWQTYPENVAELSDLHDVEPPFTSLDLAHAGLRIANPLGKLHLCDSCRLSLFAEQRSQHGVFTSKR